MRWAGRVSLLVMVAIMLQATPGSLGRAVAGLPHVTLSRIRFDPPGPDTGTESSLNGEYVVISNSGTSPVSISGWTLRDTEGHVYRFQRFTLRGHGRVRVHSGRGTNDADDLFWGSPDHLWDNKGDTAILRSSFGGIADRCTYRGPGSGTAVC
jgi:Lamin Tail Domain